MDDPEIHGQRRALREAGRDPETAAVREVDVVEQYEQ
jgi:Protein of unknown function (DUF2630)